MKSLSKMWAGMILYTLLVILFGAVVRITGSGAGCGQHWPTCRGEIAPLPRDVEMLIEFTHRLTSGLSMILLLVVTVITFRRTSSPHPARLGSVWACVFMVLEALIGARLVLLGLVGQNDSAPRAVIMAIHLVNTSALLLFMVVAYRGVRVPGKLGLKLGGDQWMWSLGALGLLVVSGAGAVTALGDTLYPVAETAHSASVAADALDPQAHFLERLRSYHPVLAFAVAGYVAWIVLRGGVAPLLRNVIVWMVAAQLAAGVINIALSAPGWLQVLHLALAKALWLVWLWGWFEAARGAASPALSTDMVEASP